MALAWSIRSRNDLREIARYISRTHPENARRFVARLQARARAAVKTPRAGRRVPEFEVEDIREVFEGGYRIVYRIMGRHIEIVTVLEGHRLLRSPTDEPDAQ